MTNQESKITGKPTVVLLLIFAFFFSVYSLTMRGVPSGGDAWGMFLVTESIVEDGDVFLDGSDSVVLRSGIGGRPVSKYGIGQSLAEIPLYIAGKHASARTKIGKPGYVLYFVTSLTSPVLAAGACVFVFLLCNLLGYRFAVSIYVTALAGLGTLLWPQSKTLFSETLQAFCLAGGLYSLFLWRREGGARNALAAGMLLGLMVATKPFLALAAAAPAVYFLIGLRARGEDSKRAAAAVAFFGSLAFWAAVVLYYNHVRFGSPLEFGYTGGTDRDGVHGFSLPLVVGLHGLLFSSGKGLIFYVPAVVLLIVAYRPFAARWPAESGTMAAVFLIMLVSYSKWNAWHADFSWGPRFLAPAAPLLALPLGVLFERGRLFAGRAGRAVATAVLFVSILVQIPGVAVSYSEYLMITRSQVPFGMFFLPNRVELRDDLLNAHYVPEFSPQAGHFWLLKHTLLRGGLTRDELNAEMARDFPWKGLMPYAPPQDPARGVGFDTWWRYFLKFYPRTARWVYPLAAALAAAAVGCGLLLAAAAAVYGRAERTRHGDGR